MPKKEKEVQFYEGVGRRDVAVARVRLYIPTKEKTVTIKGKKMSAGDIIINDNSIDKLYAQLADRKRVIAPLEATDNINRFVISIRVRGGGKMGQLEAISHGISRALFLLNAEEYKKKLRDNDLLTRDSRARERRKVGTGGKARRAKQSPKR